MKHSQRHPAVTFVAVALVMICGAVYCSAQTTEAIGDSARAVGDTVEVAAPTDTATIVWPREFRDSVMVLLAGEQGWLLRLDLPQATSRWKMNPALARYSVTPWGDFESFYAAGLAPAALSRYDMFAGDQSFANPVPLPYGEDFLRTETADFEMLLWPGSAAVMAPFGRALTMVQRLERIPSDTAHSSIYVTRGRGGFANTTFRFQNYFGPVGFLAADGSFQKMDGLYFSSNSKLERMRFVAAPDVGRRLKLDLLYAFNRLKGDRLIFPSAYGYSGYSSDYEGTYAAQARYYAGPTSVYAFDVSYKSADQKFNDVKLRTAQRFKVVDVRVANQREAGRHQLELAVDSRYCRYTDKGETTNALYYSGGVSDIVALNARTTAYAHLAVTGSSDLTPRPTAVAMIVGSLSEEITASVTASHAAIVPTAEMMYGVDKRAAFEADSVDYRLRPSDDLDIGSASGVEASLERRSEWLWLRLRGGYFHLEEMPAWTVSFDSLKYGEFSAAGIDRNVWLVSLESQWRMHPRLEAEVSYGLRRVTTAGENLTFGPAHTATGIVMYKLPIRRFLVDLHFGAGAKLRSAADRNFVGAPEDGALTADTYFTFDLKSFHFFFNFENVFDTKYTVAGLDQRGRSVWWGFNWAFLD